MSADDGGLSSPVAIAIVNIPPVERPGHRPGGPP
jgi:hypothetical protein